MRGPRSNIDGATTHAIVDAHGPGRHGFSDGNPALLNIYTDANGNATEVGAQWCEDINLLIQNTCIDGNGVNGPAGDAIEADYFELSDAVNSCAAMSDDSSFVSQRMSITGNPGTLSVTMEAGVFVESGIRRVASLERLDAGTCIIDGAPAGTAQSFTLTPNADHYVAIESDTVVLTNAEGVAYASPTRVFRLNMTTTAVGAGEPAGVDMPDGVFFAVLTTNGSGLVTQQYVNNGARIAAIDRFRTVRLRPLYPGLQMALEPVNAPTYDLDIGSASSYERPALGHFVRGVFHQESTLRSSESTTYAGHRVFTYTISQAVSSGSQQQLILFDTDDMPDDYTSVTIVADCQAKSSESQNFAMNEYTNMVYRSAGSTTLYPSAASTARAKFNNGAYPTPAPENLTNLPAWRTHPFIAFNLSGSYVRMVLDNDPADSEDTVWLIKVQLSFIEPQS